MLEAEKKHAIANLARGVSHDVNNALGSVLPLVQQMLADLQSGDIETHLLAEDLQQIEQSLQTCRRIFGGMLAMARDRARKSAREASLGPLNPLFRSSKTASGGKRFVWTSICRRTCPWSRVDRETWNSSFLI